MKNALILPLFVLALLLALAGCASKNIGSFSEGDGGAAVGGAQDSAMNAAESAPADVSAPSYASASPDMGGDASASESRKEIKTGYATIMVADVPKAYADISKLIADLGGYEFNKDESNQNSIVTVYLTVKIPPEALKKFETSLAEAVGKDAIRQYRINSEDITAAYQDSAARLESMSASLEQYRRLLEKANSIEDILAIQREITTLQTEMDALDGQIRMWDRLVEYATLDISISSNASPIEQSRRFDTASEAFNKMGNGFLSTARGFGNVLVWIVIVIVSALPVVVPIVVVLFLILRLRKRRKNRREQP
ncbi:MAG: DUF4349 domain-containing protein [Clostridiales Family XIII bacterium]|nr:DUF4349 domain-containing protein [Clostridiales Family XIII bacterium]